MDRISQLPESVAHRILSSLSTSAPSEVVRMSVLSKTWFDLIASFPILVFRSFDFTSRESFFKYVENTTSRFCHQNVTAQVLKLVSKLEEPTGLDTISRCIELVLKNGVRELEFLNYNWLDAQKYHLPNIGLSASVLKILTICNCDLPSSLTVDAVKFKSLIQLTLHCVHLDDEWIKYLTTSCPLLQELKMITCRGFKRLCVYGHQNLQQLSIDYDTPLERIDIEAPNLSQISIDEMYDSGPPQMNLVSCKKLTTVAYRGYSVPHDFLSNFPFIENLHLTTDDDDICNNFVWSSHSLKTLVLQSECDLNEIELNTPNLVLFSFIDAGQAVPDEDWPLLGYSTHLKTCTMRCSYDGCIDAKWLRKLRKFFEKEHGFKALNLYLQTDQKFVELKNLPEIKLPPYELKHVGLELDIHKESSDHVAFVATVLWFFSPQSLTLKSSFPLTNSEEHNDDIVKPICEKLLQQEDQGHTSIQVAVSNEGKTISFIKKEVVQEESG